MDEGADLFPKVLGQAWSKRRFTGNKLPLQCPLPVVLHRRLGFHLVQPVISQKWCGNSFPGRFRMNWRASPAVCKGSSIVPGSVVRRSGLASIRMDRLQVYNEQRPHWGIGLDEGRRLRPSGTWLAGQRKAEVSSILGQSDESLGKKKIYV